MSSDHAPYQPLFDGLVDDAAVFPPGLAPLDVAVREHLDRRSHPYARCIGPLLVPAISAVELAKLAAKDDRAVAEPLQVGLIIRPDSPMEPLFDAVELLRDEPRVRLTSGEVGWHPQWKDALRLDLPIVVEVGLGAEQALALDEIAAAIDDGSDVLAKFRTGPTPAWPWPDDATLAAFLDAVILRALPFKLTGGLHHALRGDYDGKPMHGLVNVLVAVHEALGGSEADDLADVLRQTQSELLVEGLAALSPEEAGQIRAKLTSYGCCGVLEPLSELAALGLIPQHP
jgi:hypothetical protein